MPKGLVDVTAGGGGEAAESELAGEGVDEVDGAGVAGGVEAGGEAVIGGGGEAVDPVGGGASVPSALATENETFWP